MSAAARVNDLHLCALTGPNENADLKIIAGSANIKINSQSAARIGDSVNCRMATSTPAIIQTGSSTVLFNGRCAARCGDELTSGGTLSQGSDNVFIGDHSCRISIGDKIKFSIGDHCRVFMSCGVSNSSISKESNCTILL